MEFYLIKNKPVIFSGQISKIEGEPWVKMKVSHRISVGLEPLKESAHGRKLCRTLENSLLENTRDRMKNLSDHDNLIISDTLRLYLISSSSTSNLGSIRLSSEQSDDENATSILDRLLDTVKDGLSMKVSIKRLHFRGAPLSQTFDVEGKDLPIEKSGALGVKYCEIDDVEFPVQMRTALREVAKFECDLTVTVTLGHNAVSDMLNGDTIKLDPLGKNKMLLEEAVCSDFVIVAENGVQVKCHKAFLAVNSDVFRAMFSSGMKEDATNYLEMPYMSEAGVRALLGYIYHFDLKDASANSGIALELLRTGHMHGMSELLEKITTLFCAKSDEWMGVDDAVLLFLFVRNLGEDADEKGLLLEKVVDVLKWYNNKSPDSLLTSELYLDLFQNNQKVALELSSLFLKRIYP